jgi:hypothetical protein
MWQKSQRNERRSALQCNRKIKGRLRSLEWKMKRREKEIIVTESLVWDASGNGSRCLIVLRYADSSE